MEVGLSCENIKQLIVGKEAVEEKTEKAIVDLERKCTFLILVHDINRSVLNLLMLVYCRIPIPGAHTILGAG